MVFGKRNLVILGFLAALLLGAVSCSVKEVRDECPVWVTVLTDRFVQKCLDEGMMSFHGVELVNREDVNFLSIIGKGFVQPVPRDFARAAVLSGIENERFSDTNMFVPYGRQAGLVWWYGETFSVNADEYVIDAVPHKEYCLVQFMFDTSPRAPEDYKWRFRMKADCSGMNIYTAEPLEGDYCCTVGPNAVGEWYGVLPRQKSNNMILEIFEPYDGSETEGRTEYTIDLGARFAEQHYDWSKEDLDDIRVKVGFAAATIQIEVVDYVGDDTYKDVHI